MVRALPDFQTPIPRNRVNRVAVDGESSNGVSVLNPENLFMTTDVDVITREYKSAKTVVDCRESVDQFELFGLLTQIPDADFAVLVRSEDFTAEKGYSLYRTRG